MALSTADTTACGDEMGLLFKMSDGRERIALELIAPAVFNRFGRPLRSKRLVELCMLFLKSPGFAKHKCDSVWVIKPDLDKPYAVVAHANKMAALDPVLPTRDPKVAYYGSFRNSHTCVALLQIKRGVLKWPGTDEYITAAGANDALKDVLDNGIMCEVWPAEKVSDNLESFRVLMASDNCQGDEQMPEDEVSIISRLKECVDTAHSNNTVKGLNIDNQVLSKVKQYIGASWTDKELNKLLDYAKSTAPVCLELLTLVSQLIDKPTSFVVPTSHFRHVATLTSEFQWSRLCFTVGMFTADMGKEAKEVYRGRHEPTLVTQRHLETFKDMPQETKNEIESYLTKCVAEYWARNKDDTAIVTAAVKEIAIFMRKICLSLIRCTSSATFADFRKGFSKAEASLRRNLQKAGAVVTGEAFLNHELDDKEIKALKSASKDEVQSSTPYLKFDNASVIANNAYRFEKKGYHIGDTLEIAKDIVAGLTVGTAVNVAQVRATTVTVTVPGKSTNYNVGLNDLRRVSEKAPPPKKQRIDELAAVLVKLPPAIRFEAASATQADIAVKQCATFALFQVAAACCPPIAKPGEHLYRLCIEPVKAVIVTSTTIKPHMFRAVPFSSALLDTKPDGRFVPCTVSIKTDSVVKKTEYYIPEVETIQPYWFLRDVAGGVDTAPLEEEYITFDVNTSFTLKSLAKMSAMPKSIVTMRVPSYVNVGALKFGDRLRVPS